MTSIGKILGIPVLLVLILGMGVYAYYYLPYDDLKQPVRLVVPEGATLDQTAKLLDDRGVVRFPFVFSQMARLLGKDRDIRAGEYSFHSSMSPRDVLQRLSRGEVALHKITIPEGLTVRQVALLLEKKGLASREEILEASLEPGFLRELGIEVSTDMPEEVYAFMSLHKQPTVRRPSVEYVPLPYSKETQS